MTPPGPASPRPPRPPGAPRIGPRLPNLDALQTFEAVARTASFTRAATELFLTQSAVSRRIQALEEALGVALFVRRNRAIELTEAGLILQRAVFDSFERLRDAVARLREVSPARLVTITCTAGFASLWLIPRLARFTAAHPDIDVRVSATSERLDLDALGIDLAVRFCALAEGAGRPLFRESLIPVCSPRLVRGGPHPLREPADLVHHTLLALEMDDGAELIADWEPWIRAMRLPAPQMKNALRFSSYADAVAAAVDGQGVVIGRLPLIKALLADGRLVAPFRPKAASRRGYFLLRSSRIAANPAAAAFAGWIESEVAVPPAA